jgi:aminoglycoside phosphotransferase (APT) family kinase protein
MRAVTEVNIEDFAALEAYLWREGRLDPTEQVSLRKLTGGVSNRTVMVERSGGPSWVIKQALSKLRVEVDWFSSPERIHREALAIMWLAELAPPGSITSLIFEDRENHLLAMQAVPSPHENWKEALAAGRVECPYFAQFGDILSAIHRRSAQRASELQQVFGDSSYFESLRLEPYYLYSARKLPMAAPFLQALVDDTRSHRVTLVHGDYSPKNILIYRGGLVLVDHEVVHFGDPAFDLGFSLAHFLSGGHYLPAHRGEFGRGAEVYWDRYWGDAKSEEWANNLETRVVRHTLGCLLARVTGRSQLEYLTPKKRARQREVVLSLLPRPPQNVPELIETFLAQL